MKFVNVFKLATIGTLLVSRIAQVAGVIVKYDGNWVLQDREPSMVQRDPKIITPTITSTPGLHCVDGRCPIQTPSTS